MKKSELKNFIRENIISALSEATEEEVKAQQELNKELEKTIDLKKDAGIEEAERAADKFNVNVFGYQTKYYKVCPGAKAFMDKVMAGDYGDMSDIKEETIRLAKLHDVLFKMELQALKDPNYAAKILDQAKYVVDTIRDQVDMMNKLSGKNIPMDAVDYLDNHIEIIKDAAKKVNEQDEKEPSDDEIKKNKSLAKAAEELAILTREIKSLAKKYSKAEGQEKEDLLKKLKSKTKLKKELDKILDK